MFLRLNLIFNFLFNLAGIVTATVAQVLTSSLLFNLLPEVRALEISLSV